MPQHSWRLTARGLENSGKVLVQDGLGVLLTRARREQRQRVGCTASRHLGFIPLLLLKHTQECNVTKKLLQTASPKYSANVMHINIFVSEFF